MNQTSNQREFQAHASNSNFPSWRYSGNKFVENYMFKTSAVAGEQRQPLTHVSNSSAYSDQRNAKQVLALNTRYSLRADRKNLPKEVLRPEYALRGTTKLLLNREALKEELNKTPYLYHVHKPNEFLSRYYRQERDGPNRVAPAPGLGFLSKPHRYERVTHLRHNVKRKGSVPMCGLPSAQRRGGGGAVAHYRLLNGEELREQLQSYPAYRHILDPYGIVQSNQKKGCLKKKQKLVPIPKH